MKDEPLPFPNIGHSRIWPENFIIHQSEKLPELKWIPLGKLTRANIKKTPNCSGIYIFTRKSQLETLHPCKNNYPLVVYIGKSNKIRDRLTSYLLDKKDISKAVSSREVRDNVIKMFRAYNDNLNIYIATISPENVCMTEDILIQLFDPVFNVDQKLNEAHYNAYNDHISASFEDAHDAYIEQNQQQNSTLGAIDKDPIYNIMALT